MEAKTITLMPISKMSLIPSLTPSNLVIPRYLDSKENWARDRGKTKERDGWWHIDQKLLVTLSEQWKIIQGLHNSLYLGEMQCLQLFSSFL